MKTNPVLASSIYQLSGPQSVRVVLTPEAVESIRSFFWGVCRICTQGETTAHVQESYNGHNFYAWVERKLTLEDVLQGGQLIYEVRRRVSDNAEELSRAVSMAELKREEAGERDGPYLERTYFVECVLHAPGPKEPRDTMFDIGYLMDLPPDGYPLSGTPMEGIRNIVLKQDPDSHKRHWAGIQYARLLRESAEERLANRVLENERMVERTAEYNRRTF